MSVTVLLTCVGGELAPQMLRELKSSERHDIRVVGVDANTQAIGRFFCDVFSVVPNGGDVGYLDAIIALVDQYSIDLIIPTSDEEALVLSDHHAHLQAHGATLACVGNKTLKVLVDKARTYEALVEHGIYVPEWQQVTDEQQLLGVLQEMYERHGDVVVKPVCERGGRGVYVISAAVQGVVRYNDRREVHADLESFLLQLIASLADSYPLIVMERLIEPVFDLDMLAWNGEPIRIVPRRRIDSAVPNEGHVIVENADLVTLGKKLIEVFNLSWLYDCDVMLDKKGRPCVLEVNPRQSGSMAVSIVAGIPIFDDLISLYKKEPVEMDLDIPFGVRVIPYKTLTAVQP